MSEIYETGQKEIIENKNREIAKWKALAGEYTKAASGLSYGGEMSLEEKVDYWMGRIILAIAKGKVRDVISLMLMAEMKESYERGIKSVKKK